MKKIILLMSALLAAVSGYPQGFFNQNGEMIKKAIEQIGLLGTYIRQAKKGYDIVDKGLKTVRSIKNGEFELHDRYYNSLRSVNPQIKGLSKVKEAIFTAETVTGKIQQMLLGVDRTPSLDVKERRYLRNVCMELLKSTDGDVQTLFDLLTDGKIQLTDDERIRRVIAVEEELNSKSVFVQQFSTVVTYIIANRSSERRDAQNTGKLHY